MADKFMFLLALGFALGLLIDETTFADVDSEPALIAQGRLLFEETAGGEGVGCAVCHGHFGMGDEQIGPNNRGAPEARIRKALATVDRMSFLHLTDDEIKAIAAFLGYLGKLYPIKIATMDYQFEPNRVFVPANRQIQFILNNRSNNVCSFSSADAGIKEKQLEAGKVDDVVWQSPAKAAVFTAQCASRPETILAIEVKIDAD